MGTNWLKVNSTCFAFKDARIFSRCYIQQLPCSLYIYTRHKHTSTNIRVNVCLILLFIPHFIRSYPYNYYYITLFAFNQYYSFTLAKHIKRQHIITHSLTCSVACYAICAEIDRYTHASIMMLKLVSRIVMLLIAMPKHLNYYYYCYYFILLYLCRSKAMHFEYKFI